MWHGALLRTRRWSRADIARCKPQLRVDQFFVDGFVERKIILVHDILKLCQRKHLELKRNAKKQSGDKPFFAARPRTSPSPVRALVRSLASGGRNASSSAEGFLAPALQPKIVVDGGASARVVRVVEDNEECGLPRSIAPLPMTSSVLPRTVSNETFSPEHDRRALSCFVWS
jgi:hypothetical protein